MFKLTFWYKQDRTARRPHFLYEANFVNLRSVATAGIYNIATLP